MTTPRKILCVGGSKHGEFIEVGAPLEINLKELLERDFSVKENTETYTVKFTQDGKKYGLFETAK